MRGVAVAFAGALFTGLVAPGVVWGQTVTTPGPVFVSIGDIPDTLTASVNAPNGPGGVPGGYIPEGNPTIYRGFDASASGVIANELPGLPAQGGQLGAVDLHFEYLSSTPPAVGIASVVNFNIFGSVDEPNTTLSDTLSITFTGHQPGGGDNNNVSVDLHFRSDNDTILPTALPNAVSVTEPNGYQDLSLLIGSNGGPQDFNLQYASVPEPAAVSLLAVGALATRGRRRRRTQR